MMCNGKKGEQDKKRYEHTQKKDTTKHNQVKVF